MQDLDVLSKLNLNHLVVLLAVMRAGSVTEAANLLGRSQSAISHALSRLRSDLDDPLLVRSGIQLVPTPRAEAIERELEAIFPSLGSLLAAPGPFDPATADDTFSIAGSDLTQHLFASNVFPPISRLAPHIKLRLLERPTGAELVEALANHLDFSMTVRVPEHRSLRQAPLFKESFHCVMCRDHEALRGGDRIDLDAYCELRHILFDRSGEGWGMLDNALLELGRSREVAITVPNFMVIGSLLLDSNLITTVPTRHARVMVSKHSSLVMFEPPLETPTFQSNLVWHERNDLEPAHAWMRKTLLELFSNQDAEALLHAKNQGSLEQGSNTHSTGT